jgi:hypothetical protein
VIIYALDDVANITGTHRIRLDDRESLVPCC